MKKPLKKVVKNAARNAVKKVKQKIVKKPDLKTRVYGELLKIRKKLDKQLTVVSKKFQDEVAALKKKSKKMGIDKELDLLKKRGDSLLKDMSATTSKVMAEVKKDYNFVLADVRKRLK